jgi:manganese/iron transport system substrate-binding protein
MKILASTTIVADVVKNVCGDLAQVKSLLPPDASPHSYEPVPRDLAEIDQADILFINGGGLETFIDKMIQNPEIKQKIVSVSENVKFLHSTADFKEDLHEHKSVDPHVWMDPNNVIIWVNNITKTLCEKDTGNCTVYKQNGQAYKKKLAELDAWIAEQFKSISKEDRIIVTDHRMLGYFTKRYGLEQAGTIIPGFSALAEPSARDIVKLENMINNRKIKAILVSANANPDLAERIAEDTGTRLIRFYGGALSKKGGKADTYLKYMRYNVNAIIKALR